LRSEDFFGIEKFKTATLVFKKIKSNGNDQYAVTADLTIKGITKPISFNITVKGNTAKTVLNVDRTKYGIKYGSGSFFSDLGDKTISDEFILEVNLVL
jgi:polyisoprenoid-binding protein YceI